MCVKNYLERPPSVAADTIHMIAKSRTCIPGSQVDLRPYLEYTGHLNDYVVFDDLVKLLESDGIKHIDNKIIVAALHHIVIRVTRRGAVFRVVKIIRCATKVSSSYLVLTPT